MHEGGKLSLWTKRKALKRGDPEAASGSDPRESAPSARTEDVESIDDDEIPG